MASPLADAAISDALQRGSALLKFMSPNDVGTTGSHQAGFYLPKNAWQMYTPHPPLDGRNDKHEVTIRWEGTRETQSVVTWYGTGTRSEYRLTRFGRNFMFMDDYFVGSLLILVPKDISNFRAHVLDIDEDILEAQVALGVEIISGWGIYDDTRQDIEEQDECLRRRFGDFTNGLDDFPSGDAFSEEARTALIGCVPGFANWSADDKLIKGRDTEYDSFKLVEQSICGPIVERGFRNIDEFVSAANSITNRRRARAGRSFENHIRFTLEDAGIPFEHQPDIDGRPDFVIPSADAYNDRSYSVDGLFVIGAKTTSRERWRQLLDEGRRVPRKYFMTLQPNMSNRQYTAIVGANVRLVVPNSLHRGYPADTSADGLLSVDGFIDVMRRTLGR